MVDANYPNPAKHYVLEVVLDPNMSNVDIHPISMGSRIVLVLVFGNNRKLDINALDDNVAIYYPKTRVDSTLMLHYYIDSMSNVHASNVYEGMVVVTNYYFYIDHDLCMVGRHDPVPTKIIMVAIYKTVLNGNQKIDKQKGTIEDKIESFMKRSPQLWRFLSTSTLTPWTIRLIK